MFWPFPWWGRKGGLYKEGVPYHVTYPLMHFMLPTPSVDRQMPMKTLPHYLAPLCLLAITILVSFLCHSKTQNIQLKMLMAHTPIKRMISVDNKYKTHQIIKVIKTACNLCLPVVYYYWKIEQSRTDGQLWLLINLTNSIPLQKCEKNSVIIVKRTMTLISRTIVNTYGRWIQTSWMQT